jgi:hypothetical protein
MKTFYSTISIIIDYLTDAALSMLVIFVIVASSVMLASQPPNVDLQRALAACQVFGDSG